jgi:acyl-CoA thioesterase YciA
MDLAAGNAAVRRARARHVILVADGMVFNSPLHIGETDSAYAHLISTRCRSMKIQVEPQHRFDDGDE